jgi:hypothetical protein
MTMRLGGLGAVMVVVAALGAACGGANTGAGGGGGAQPKPFACGPSLTCDATKQLCVDSYTEGLSDDTYSCQALPAECAADASCSCLTTQTIFSECPNAACTDGAPMLCKITP